VYFIREVFGKDAVPQDSNTLLDFDPVLIDTYVRQAYVFTFTICLSGMISVGALLAWHIYLCITNQTTVEFYVNMDRRQACKEQGIQYHNPFDMGWRQNLARVFGNHSWWLTVLLPSLEPPPPPLYPFVLKERSPPENRTAER